MKNQIFYEIGLIPKTDQIIEVYKSSGITRPISEKKRIEQMYANSNLIVSAWDENKLVGISRSLTDFCYCCYYPIWRLELNIKRKASAKN